mgnify:CR=1 FL=1
MAKAGVNLHFLANWWDVLNQAENGSEIPRLQAKQERRYRERDLPQNLTMQLGVEETREFLETQQHPKTNKNPHIRRCYQSQNTRRPGHS